jgi:hypothetical protein
MMKSRKMLSIMLVLLVVCLAMSAQAAIVGTGTSPISFDTATPTPATTAVGTPAVDYQGYVTGHTVGGVPQLTVGSTVVAIEDPATDWDNGGQGFAPIGAWTYRDKTAANPHPAPFSLLGSVTPSAPTTTGTANDMTEFKITGISFAVYDITNFQDDDQVSVRILDGSLTVVSTGTLEAIGYDAVLNPTALNAASLQGGGIFSGDAIFAPAAGHLTGPFTVQLALDENGSWTAAKHAFWLSLDSAELTVDYTVWSAGSPNTAPVVDAGLDFYTWFDGVERVETLEGVLVTDDGAPEAAVTTWAVVSEPDAVNYPIVIDDPSSLTSSVTMSVTGRYVLTLTGNDSLLQGEPDELIIDVFADACDAAQNQPGYEKLPGDIDNDCDVDLADFAMFAQDWLKSDSLQR